MVANSTEAKDFKTELFTIEVVESEYLAFKTFPDVGIIRTYYNF